MTRGFLAVRTFVNNCPFSIIRTEDRVMVARLIDSELWFYGLYATWEKANQVAKDLGNGVVLEVAE